MESDRVISVKVLDFTEYPGPRYRKQGSFSGEEFYDQVLKGSFETAVMEGIKLCVDLDNTAGYASSFLDEAFGNLTYDYSQNVVNEHLTLITTEEPDWKNVVFENIIPEWEHKRVNQIARKR